LFFHAKKATALFRFVALADSITAHDCCFACHQRPRGSI
jgi:hypothetical protein